MYRVSVVAKHPPVYKTFPGVLNHVGCSLPSWRRVSTNNTKTMKTFYFIVFKVGITAAFPSFETWFRMITMVTMVTKVTLVTMVTMLTMCTLVTFELQVDEFVLDVQTGPLLPPLAPPMLYK